VLPTCKLTFQAKKPDFKPYPKELKTIGDHLKKRRLELKMLQKEVAERFGTTVCTVRNWEKNRSNPSLPFIPKIIQFLGYIPYDTQTHKKIAVSRQTSLSQKELARPIKGQTSAPSICGRKAGTGRTF
jgi:transcriptional regulator with XRE-family HTH domain